ncbi:hypothetical protein [Weissella cibaria]|uniref:hypothetical protein n=1 Tax=Weissella cibaria TaxID=137591 RepID=UPI0022E6E22E|nr:hypothetical protein [Weissella cibaria]
MAKKLYWAYVSFVDQPSGKELPVLYVRENQDSYFVYRLTTKFANKSPQIQKNYFEILDWQAAGLPQKSWIDRGRINKLPRATTKLRHIGELTTHDIKRLAAFKS